MIRSMIARRVRVPSPVCVSLALSCCSWSAGARARREVGTWGAGISMGHAQRERAPLGSTRAVEHTRALVMCRGHLENISDGEKAWFAQAERR
jgi:hypothetical protein